MKKYKQLVVLKLGSHQSHIIHPLETKTVSTRLVNRQNWLISYSKILIIAYVCYYLLCNK